MKVIKRRSTATAVHESRYLMQARPYGQYVDLQRQPALTTPSWTYISLPYFFSLSRIFEIFSPVLQQIHTISTQFFPCLLTKFLL